MIGWLMMVGRFMMISCLMMVSWFMMEHVFGWNSYFVMMVIGDTGIVFLHVGMRRADSLAVMGNNSVMTVMNALMGLSVRWFGVGKVSWSNMSRSIFDGLGNMSGSVFDGLGNMSNMSGSVFDGFGGSNWIGLGMGVQVMVWIISVLGMMVMFMRIDWFGVVCALDRGSSIFDGLVYGWCGISGE